MSERRFVGETLKKEVIKQLEIRENLLGNPQTNPDNYLLYKNGNNAWVRVISGVDVFDEGTGEYSSKLAKNFVLSGGELYWDTNTKTFKKREGFNTGTSSTTGRYKFDETLGVRPEGGITGFSIQNIQRFGTIRKAEIRFLVWTLKDLERAQDIYFRPGMTLITEWGNSSYISNDNNFIDLANPKETKKFFEKTNLTNKRTLEDLDSSSDIDKVISKNIEDSSYNYDGFIGLISNFSWFLRPDGGYDCTLTVVSKGSLLSSLSVIKGSDSITGEAYNSIPDEFFTKRPLPDPPDESEEEPGFGQSLFQEASKLWGRLTGDPNVSDLPADTDIESKERLSLMHFFCSKVEEIDIQDLDNDGFITYSNFNNSVFSEQGLQRSEQVKDKYYRIRKPNPLIPFLKEELGDREENFTVVGFDGKVDKESAKFRYISLRTFLALVNIAYLGGNRNKLLPTFSTSINRYGEYETFSNHFSFDPASVILPKSPKQTELQAPKRTVAGWISKEFVLSSSTIGEETTSLAKIYSRLLDRSDSTVVPISDVVVNNVSDNIKKRLILPGASSTEKVGTRPENNILNIYISTRLIISKLDALYSRNAVPEDLDVITFVESILQEINSVLGGINDLEVSYTSGNDVELAYIVDRNKINPDLTQQNTAEINIRGLKNTVSGVELKTFISSKLGAQISISSTGGSENSIESNLGLVKYNENRRDRFRVNYKQLTEAEVKSLGAKAQAELDEQKIKDQTAEWNRRVDSKKKFDKFIVNIADAYARFNNTIFGDLKNSQYRSNLFSKIKGEGISRTKAVLARKYIGTEEEPQNVLPLELSITLNGISGLTVGEVFKLKKNSAVLPKNYEEFGYIITGLDSEIQNNKWTTKIRANLFRLQKSTTALKSNNDVPDKYTTET